jgi:hypothetical protein
MVSPLFSVQSDPSAAWERLLSEDATKGYRAKWDLVRGGDGVVPFLKSVLIQPDVPDGRIRRLVATLDADDPSARDTALSELEKLGARAEEGLRKMIGDKVSAEIRLRVERLLEDLDRQTRRPRGERLRRLRAIAALELIGTDTARALLKSLAFGSKSERERLLATACLKRLAGSPSRDSKKTAAMVEMALLIDRDGRPKKPEDWAKLSDLAAEIRAKGQGFTPTGLLEWVGKDDIRMILIEDPVSITIPGDAVYAFHLLDLTGNQLGRKEISAGNRSIFIGISLEELKDRPEPILRLQVGSIMFREPEVERTLTYGVSGDGLTLIDLPK